MKHPPLSLWHADVLRPAVGAALRRLHPRHLVRHPVILLTAVGAAIVTVQVALDLTSGRLSGFTLQVALWLWFTVLFANFTEAVAESRGRAQAGFLRRSRSRTSARRLRDGREEEIPAADLRTGDLVVCSAGSPIPADGEVVEGIASVDESAITGESAPVIRESGGDRSAVTGGTRVLSDRIVVRVTAEPGHGFLDRMISLVEGATRQRTPNEVALGLLLLALSIVFLAVVGSLPFFARHSAILAGNPDAVPLPPSVLVALFVCLIPTTIGGLVGAIGISGIDRLVRRNVIALSGRAVEAAGDIGVLLLDKTGTITLGSRQAVDFLPAPGVSPETLAAAAQLASLADETPEGRSIVVLAKDRFGLRTREEAGPDARFVPFSAEARMSGVDLSPPGKRARSLRKGSIEAVRTWVASRGGSVPDACSADADKVARAGGTPLAVAEDGHVLGIFALHDVVKGGLRERFATLRRMGIRTIMITGDNPLTAAAIAAEAGVDDFIAEATPERKLRRIREEQAAGHLVAMTGDGTNDAPALAQADVGVAMNTGTQAAREAGNMVDLDSNPAKLIDIVEVGKQLLITRGALTCFSVANDVAKYFAILPALFLGLYAVDGGDGPLSAFNLMGLHSPSSAILSAVIFNALVILALLPLALRGVTYRPVGASRLLARNLLVYGLGGLIAPFIGIKAVDLIVVALHLA